MKKKKLAIIGASYLQRPLVETAKNMDIETHVFAWREGNVVEDISDYYYPISILDKEGILDACRKIDINGIISIASDIAMPTVNYIAEKMGLVGNSTDATLISTDKFEMRKALLGGGVACPYFKLYKESNYKDSKLFNYPLIVKPTDRSGSRGVTKVYNEVEVNIAIDKALKISLSNRVIVEEFMEGREFSVEMISFKGKHSFLAVTDKVTTGAPYFVETEHHQPANIPAEIEQKIISTVKKSLDVLQIENGASHSEVFLTNYGDIRVVEIAGRMGGELIGSDMVELSTGFDFVKGVIDVALYNFTPVDYSSFKNDYSGVYYVLPRAGVIKSVSDNSKKIKNIVRAITILKKGDKIDEIIDGAGKRAGIFVYHSKKGKCEFNPNDVLKFITQ